MSNYAQQLQKMKASPGFVAALDQSGGSTPKALSSYGIKENAWSNEAEMFALVHQMRMRIITSPSFTGERILGAILFENTMDSDIEGQPSADFLWNAKRVVPFLKVDQGLAAEKGGVQLLRPMPNIAAGLVPIIEPEVDIHCPEKALAEGLLKTALLEKLNELPVDQLVLLKLTLPEQDDFYAECVGHPKVVRVLALSGGYSREECNNRLRRNRGIVASFSRALVEGLSIQQSDGEYNALLNESIQSIFEASTTKTNDHRSTGATG